MSSFSDSLEASVLNYFFRNNAETYTPAATIYMALHTTPGPTDAASANEITAVGNYARQAVTFGAPTGTSPTTISNTGAVSWTASGANYGDIVAVSFWTALSGGTMLAWDGITSATVNIGDTLNFAIGAIDITMD